MDEYSHIIHVGNNHYVNSDHIVLALHKKAQVAKRIAKEARREGRFIDLRGKLRGMGVLLMDNGVVVQIAFRPQDIANYKKEPHVVGYK